MRDDGAGIDEQRVREVAIARGVISAEQAEGLSRRELQNLIFMPGFSTASEVSELSGRGVGLDVVKTNIGHLSGIIDLQSEPGEGSTFRLTLPVTLAIMRALVVAVSGRTYAVPLNSVLEILSVTPAEIRTVERREVISLRGQTLPFLRLAQLFGHPAREDLARHFVVVVGLAEQRLGIAVDELLGQQDIVTKPLGGRLRDVRGDLRRDRPRRPARGARARRRPAPRGGAREPRRAQRGEPGATVTGFDALLDAFFYRPDEAPGPALDLAAPAPEAVERVADEAPAEFVAFTLERECYALPIRTLREIVKLQPLTEVPRSEARLLGVINLRGEVIPVYDLKLRLGLAEAPAQVAGPEADLAAVGRAARVLVLRSDAGPAGVLVDRVDGVVRLRPSTIEAMPRGVGHGEWLKGIGRAGDRLYLLLDAEAVLG